MVRTPEEVMKRIVEERANAAKQLEDKIDMFLNTWDGETPISVDLGQKTIPVSVRNDVVDRYLRAGWAGPRIEGKSGAYYFSMSYTAPEPEQ